MRAFVKVPFILFLAASAVSAASNVKVTVTGPEFVTDVRDLKVTSTVTNNGQDVVNILHEPNGALSNFPTDKFIITNERNLQPEFTGIKAKYVPAIAAKSGQYTTLKPGESVTTEHDLSAAYEFTTSGAGEYTIHSSERLYVVDSSGNIATVSADTEKHVTKIAANSAKYSTRSIAKHVVIEKRSQNIGYNGCSNDQQSQIAGAVPIATTYVQQASTYLAGIAQGTTRYTTWFGAYADSRKSLVQSHFGAIGNSLSSVTYDCTCTDPGVFAFVHPNDPSTIYLCGLFWNAPTQGTDSKAGTLVHESTHFTIYGGTQDIAYGQVACQQLAQNSPDQAVSNADSYEYFAENNLPLP